MTDEKATHAEQLPLFSEEGGGRRAPQPPARPGLTARTPLNVALGRFEGYMEERGFTENTQQAFRLDMELLVEYLGAGVQLDRIAPANLNAFLKWMEEGQGKNVSCSPKTMERRITTLKVFFGWLAETGVLRRDPAAPLIHQAVSTPLPEVLRDPEVEAMLAVTGRMRQGGPEEEGDPRPHLLTTLVLHTGIKKGETVRIALNHIDLTNPNSPALWVRYKRPSRRHKERRIALPVWWPTILREYLDAYAPRQHLFPWTARNLEYVLTKVAREAGLQRLTFEMLRWTCAVHDYVEGMDLEALRHKLGLSEISWYETEGKLALLAQHFGGRSEPSPSS